MKPERRKGTPQMTVALRRQTAPEQRRFESALELLLIEMVRQEIRQRQDGKHAGETTRR